MSNFSGSGHRETRSSALWGTGNRGGDSRSNALWGKGGRALVTLLAVSLLTAPLAATAHTTPKSPKKQEPKAGKTAEKPSLAGLGPPRAYVPDSLRADAKAHEDRIFKVIVEGSARKLKVLSNIVQSALNFTDSRADGIDERFEFIHSVSAELTGKDILELARRPGITAITPDVPVRPTAVPTSTQVWPAASGIRPLWGTDLAPAPAAPAIAIVDSGIDKTLPDFGTGARVIDRQVFTTLPQSPGYDTRGHGTFVAGIAAGEAAGYAGAAPQANLIDLDVMDDSGQAMTSAVIAAAEWIYLNRASRNIRVANFSLHSTRLSNFTTDPLDKAVEKLWFSGVVVVVAAGNYGIATGPSGVKYAPGNDPFVITVGALDLDGTTKVIEHELPHWSAYGYTNDGFLKPEVGAAGRYMIGPVPPGATLRTAKPANVVSAGYMRLSGTSFAAPVVAGAAAQILARHPDWTPDQVKGALMLTARFVMSAPPKSVGVGEVNASKASGLVTAPNPNAALSRYVVADAVGNRSFDAAAWTTAARASVSWDSVSWSDAAWSTASWSSVSWTDVSWSDVSWADVSWADTTAVADVSWEDAAGTEGATPPPLIGDYYMNPTVEAELAADPALGP